MDHNKPWKILKEMGIPDHLTCLLRNMYAVKKQQLGLDMEQQTGSKLGKEYVKAACCHPDYLTYMWNTSCEMLAWMTHQIARRNNNLRYADDTTVMVERKEELRSLLMKLKEESGKTGLKLNIQKTKIMAFGPILSCEIDGGKVADFIFLGSKITVDSDCCHKIKRCLLLGRNAMTSLFSILKSRDITLPTKVCIIKVMVFPVVMYGC